MMCRADDCAAVYPGAIFRPGELSHDYAQPPLRVPGENGLPSTFVTKNSAE
jgi:hypothetical protein